MIFLDQIGIELQKESQQQQADMHAVGIGIGRNDYLIIPESLHTIFNIQGSLQQIEFLIFVYDLFGQSETIQWFTAKAEDCLQIGISTFCDGTAGRITFGNENTGFVAIIAFGIVVMNTTI